MGQADSTSTIRVFLVAEHRLFRQILVRRFEKRPDLCVVGEGCCSEVTAERISATDCDVLVLDSLGKSDDADLSTEILRESPQVKALFFGMENDPDDFLSAVRSGASGYVLKDASAGDLITAIRNVAQGVAVCPSSLCMTLFKSVASQAQEKSGGAGTLVGGKSRLTLRQRQLVDLVAKGLTNKEIAASLNLSEFTVKNHLQRLMRRVDADTRFEAVDLIRASGLLTNAT
ncbi:MAG: response regulator transcription factor [Candidatus Acidiferrum sp.]